MTDLVPYQDKVLSSYDDVEKAARAMAGSGFFQDTRQASQAIVKILAAREIGLGPFAGMTGINIIQGRPAFGANIMAACVKKSGRYNYRVTEMTDKACTIEFLERLDGRWASCGVSTFTLEDAKKAGTKNLDKFPRNMLFARAMSNGVRWYCPDVMNGSVVYTPEELGAETDQDGNVISVESVEVVEAKKPEVKQIPATATSERYHRPMSPDILVEALDIKSRKAPGATESQQKLVELVLLDYFNKNDALRHAVLEYLTGNAHFKDLTAPMVTALLGWLDPQKSEDGSGEYKASAIALQELKEVASLFSEKEGEE